MDPRYARRNLKWNGWGWVDATFPLHGHDDALWSLLADTTGVSPLPSTPSVAWEDVVLPVVRTEEEEVEALRSRLSADARVTTDAYERLYHAAGRSYHDLIRLRTGTLSDAPDLVVYPSCADDVQAVLRFAHAYRWSVIPFGGGSSVVGGVEALRGAGHRAILSLDMTSMGRVLEVDRYSRTARVEAGCYGPSLEESLQAQGLTLGHYPQSFEFSTIGGWVAARSSGQQSNRYGSAEKFVVSLRLITPTGELRTLDVPKTAAGPSLVTLVAGSEGAFGVIVDVTVRVHEIPSYRDYRGIMFPSFGAGVEAIRAMEHAGVRTAMIRLSDEDETHFLTQVSTLAPRKRARQRLVAEVLRLRGLGRSPCLMLVGVEEDDEAAGVSTRARVLSIARTHGGVAVGTRPGSSWYAGRFAMPYLRDPLMDRGLGVDTLETSIVWDRLDATYVAVREAIRAELGGAGAVMTHISHTYASGASLYFTFFFARDRSDEVGQWTRLKKAASDAIAACGATISHHHGAGLDHRPWMHAEVGAVGMAMLEGVKRAVDPEGIMNPGKLVTDISVPPSSPRAKRTK